ncbi:MAG: hypothetical protein WCK27_00100 [Verrucomicrobiota bacterium]
MKILSEPSSGKIRNEVAYVSRYGQCRRAYVIPKNTWSPARDHMRDSFGRLSRIWSQSLTEAQRVAWCEAGPKVQSAKRLGKSGPLTGQQHFQGINSARARLGLEMLLLPPAPVVFGPNPVGQLVITNDDNGVHLLLNISGPVTEYIMVFGQAPCSSGRRKRRNVSYLGLVSAAQAGLSDITDLYVARYGEPAAGQRVFIVTRQQKDGWEGFDQETHEIVPDKPSAQQSAATGALPLPVPMHKGCTRDAQGISAPPVQDSPRIGNGEVVAQASQLASEPSVRHPAGIRVLPAAEAKSAASGEVGQEASTLVLQEPSERCVPAAPRPVTTWKSSRSTGCRDWLIEEWPILSRGSGVLVREQRIRSTPGHERVDRGMTFEQLLAHVAIEVLAGVPAAGLRGDGRRFGR